jgi:hypothetical protein
MPTPKQMEKLAAEATEAPAAAPDAPLPAEYWDSVLKDPRAQADGAQMRQRRLSEIRRHVLRISCRRCGRTVEIQTADAVQLYGGNAAWKDVAQRLLDSACQQAHRELVMLDRSDNPIEEGFDLAIGALPTSYPGVIDEPWRESGLRGDQWRMSRSIRLSRTCANRGIGARPFSPRSGLGGPVARRWLAS